MTELALSVLTEAHLRDAMDAMPVPVVAFDPYGRILCWNQEARRCTGWTLQDLQAGALERLFPNPLERACLIEEWSRRGDNFEGWVWRVSGRDGRKVALTWTSQGERHPIPGWSRWMVAAPVVRDVARSWRPPYVQVAG
jgi:PAS domain S-box-containing protein